MSHSHPEGIGFSREGKEIAEVTHCRYALHETLSSKQIG